MLEEGISGFFKFSTLSTIGFSYIAFVMLRYVNSFPSCLRAFSVKGWYALSKALFWGCWDDHVIYYTYVLYYVYDSHIETQSCIPRKNAPGWWWIMFIICSWTQFASILVKILHLCSSRKFVFLSSYYLFIPFLYLGKRDFWNGLGGSFPFYIMEEFAENWC
jgi:hypothetical protein